MTEYTGNDFALDLLAGLYAEHDRIRAEQGEEAMLTAVYDDVMTIGGLMISLYEDGYTDAEIAAEIHMRQHTGQGFTHIKFDCASD